MQSNSRTTLVVAALATVVALVIAGSMVLAWHFGDPHIVNRGGALVAALAAGGVLLQIVYEVRLEESRRKLEEAMPPPEGRSQMPTDVLADKLIEQKRLLSMADLTKRRLRVASCVVLCAMVGETIHGFGDLMFCSVVACSRQDPRD